MELSRELKIILPAIIVLSLVLLGGYYIYTKVAGTQETPVVTQSPSPTRFPTANASPTPVETHAQTSPSPIAQTQPETGLSGENSTNIGIFVDSPTQNAKVISPIKISGSANVFEGHIQIRIKDAAGNLIGSNTATACMGNNPCPFAKSVYYSTPSTLTGTVELFSPSPKGDGTEDFLQVINVRF